MAIDKHRQPQDSWEEQGKAPNEAYADTCPKGNDIDPAEFWGHQTSLQFADYSSCVTIVNQPNLDNHLCIEFSQRSKP